MLGVLVTGMLVPYNDPRLLQSTGNAAESPYVIAMQIAGIKGLPHVVNAGVFTSAFSAGNSFLYTSSRVLYGLALRGQAPRIFIKCTKNGLPWVAVLTCSAFGLLSFLNISASSAQAFTWLVSLSAVGSFFSWFSINLTYLGFCEWPPVCYPSNTGTHTSEYRQWSEGPRYRPQHLCLLEQFSTISVHLGRVLDHPLYTSERLCGVLGLQCLRFPYLLYKRSPLCRYGSRGPSVSVELKLTTP